MLKRKDFDIKVVDVLLKAKSQKKVTKWFNLYCYRSDKDRKSKELSFWNIVISADFNLQDFQNKLIIVSGNLRRNVQGGKEFFTIFIEDISQIKEYISPDNLQEVEFTIESEENE